MGSQKITLEITGLHEALGQDYEIEEPPHSFFGINHFLGEYSTSDCFLLKINGNELTKY